MRINKEEYHMDIARITAKRSSCSSKQVGLVLVNDEGRIMMCSYNGVPKGQTHCSHTFKEEDIKKSDILRQSHHQWSLLNELHAEQNMVAYCARNGIETKDTTVYITISPCVHCAKILLVAGIKKVVYDIEYDLDKEGLEFLRRNKIEVVHYGKKQ